MLVLANSEGRFGMAAAVEALRSGASALDAVETGIRPVEAETSVRSVGRGGAPNLLGEVECDAAIMEGTTLQAGAVGAVKETLHVISLARRVLEGLPHVFLVGAGAEQYAREVGLAPEEMLTPEARAAHERWLAENAPEDLEGHRLADLAWKAVRGRASGGTTVFLALDQEGRLAGGTSTSGMARSYPGRLGDSPVIGGGLYVDDRYGACGCTHAGEMAIRAATARSVILYIKGGASVEEACHEAVKDLRHLQGGHQGAVIIHAIDARGTPCVLSTRPVPKDPTYCFWSEEMAAFETRATVVAGAS